MIETYGTIPIRDCLKGMRVSYLQLYDLDDILLPERDKKGLRVYFFRQVRQAIMEHRDRFPRVTYEFADQLGILTPEERYYWERQKAIKAHKLRMKSKPTRPSKAKLAAATKD